MTFHCRRHVTLILLLTALFVAASSSIVVAQQAADRGKLPMRLSPFQGKIGDTYKESQSDWQEPPSAPDGAPNVVVILLDDVGFGQTSTFGGLLPAPNHLHQC